MPIASQIMVKARTEHR